MIGNYVFKNDRIGDNTNISKCASTLLGTLEGTIPGWREFGMANDYTSIAYALAKNMFVVDWTRKSRKFLPEYSTKGISFAEADERGQMTPTITLGVKGK